MQLIIFLLNILTHLIIEALIHLIDEATFGVTKLALT